MNRSLSKVGTLGTIAASAVAISAIISAMGSHEARAQGAFQCNDFVKLRTEAQQRAAAIAAAEKRKADRKEVCALVTRFSTSEAAVIKFLVSNKTWCGIPEQAISTSKMNHEKTLKFRTMVCSDAPQPHPKAPTLSDAIGTPTLDTAKNTKTGHGTFDSLTGNPLAK